MNKIYAKSRVEYWSFWPSVFFTLLTFAVFAASQTFAFIVGLYWKIERLEGKADFEYKDGALYVNGIIRKATDMMDGTMLSISALTSSIICGLLIILIIKLKRGSDLKEYLRLSIPKPAKLFFWLSIGVALTIITELLTRNLDLFQSPIMNNAFNNMENPLLFFLAIVVVAPTFEEIFYRGFIFKFLEMTRVGGVGAVLITSILFTLSHMQYEISILITVVPMALVLGFSRLFTRSLIVPITLHMFVNIIVFLLTALNI